MSNEIDLKLALVKAYKIIAYLQLDDLTYAHITTRPDGADYFYILQFGKLFNQATLQNIIKVSMDGKILDGEEVIYNITGYIIHSAIYKNRPDINAIYHLHTRASIAVSTLKCGLLPLSQHSMPFFENIGYHDYNSLALDPETHSNDFACSMGNYKNLLLRSHGLISCGKTLQEGLFYVRFLEEACNIQLSIMSTQSDYVLPSKETCRKARHDMLSFERNLGQMDWNALSESIDQLEKIKT